MLYIICYFYIIYKLYLLYAYISYILYDTVYDIVYIYIYIYIRHIYHIYINFIYYTYTFSLSLSLSLSLYIYIYIYIYIYSQVFWVGFFFGERAPGFYIVGWFQISFEINFELMNDDKCFFQFMTILIYTLTEKKTTSLFIRKHSAPEEGSRIEWSKSCILQYHRYNEDTKFSDENQNRIFCLFSMF